MSLGPHHKGHVDGHVDTVRTFPTACPPASQNTVFVLSEAERRSSAQTATTGLRFLPVRDMSKMHRQGTLMIGIRLLLMTSSCAGAAAPTIEHHQVSPVSPDPEDVVEVLLGSSADVFCQLQPSLALNKSCISIQTKDTGEKNSKPLFLKNPEQKVEVTEQVLLYLYEGQEKPKHRSLMYQNRTRRLRGGDVGVEILNISASDNTTIIQCVVCPGCRSCYIKREITLRVVERTERLISHFTIQPTHAHIRDGGGSGNPTGKEVDRTVIYIIVAMVVVVVISIIIAIIIVYTRRKRGTSEVTDGRQMAAVEMGTVANVEVGRAPVNRSPGTTQHQQNGSAVITPPHQDELTVTTQHQQNGSSVTTQNGSAVSTEAPEQEPLLRNRDSDGDEGHSCQSN